MHLSQRGIYMKLVDTVMVLIATVLFTLLFYIYGLCWIIRLKTLSSKPDLNLVEKESPKCFGENNKQNVIFYMLFIINVTNVYLLKNLK